jgi:Uma2 family endonuclease
MTGSKQYQSQVQADATTLNDTDTFVHYYDQHPTEEDLMGESVAQSRLIAYLLQVLEWLYRVEGWFVVNDLNIYRRKQRYEYPLAPDVAVFKGVVVAEHNRRIFRSWRLYEPDRPPPQVVFEICSDTTWKDDLYAKPAKYAALGVREYFLYDPNEPPYFAPPSGRLRGWQFVAGVPTALEPDPQGRLWSAELASYLAADGAFLRLYDSEGQQRLTQAEAERAAKEAERAAREAERAAKEAERAAKETERAAKETERAAKEAAWAKLRELGIEPPEG